ncbi:hypothetical protein Gotri_007802 [Gossypium trilobum]|uniref:Ribosomal RNA small subunit methyltransferase NEP1-like n=1 Tax=Gossypium trilobum TaxID=34281 RepID=A0A7J9EHC3_9ROSI|nr:hypothetical protein [Gossypium trilobum]
MSLLLHFETLTRLFLFDLFNNHAVQLLQKLNITAVGKREKLLRVIKNPVTNYFPVNSRKIGGFDFDCCFSCFVCKNPLFPELKFFFLHSGFSYSSDKLVKMRKYVDAVGDDVNLVFVVGAMAHGKIEVDYIDDFIAISGYPLSAAMCIARITEALADKWSIL